MLAKGKELVIEALGPDLSVEITALLARAQDLLSHHGSLAKPLAPLDDVSWQRQPAASHMDRDVALGWEKESVPTTVETEPNGSGNATRDAIRLECPHNDCDGELQTFSRWQDLERHYALRTELVVQ